MKNIRTAALGAVALMCLAGGAQAYTHHPSTPAERAQTKALNEEQLKEAQQENANLAMNTSSTATDASANMAANSLPAANTDATLTRPPGSGPTSGR
ncbi:MAG TPA: hypothetical protein VHX99_06530 [Rhizomicrobium sp.]|jgi:hypothetical protein|nr:hypothetical protein [Rhizomicrobium sp.]